MVDSFQRALMGLFAALTCVLTQPLAYAEPLPQKPNIVVILVDDMGFGDPQCYNPQSKCPTPHIDRLAREGMRFTDAHAPGSVCHPSRYGLLTGRYPFRRELKWAQGPCIDQGRMTIASLAQSQGYRTAMVGKWHLGFTNYKQDKPHRGGPADRGFGSFFGIPASTDIPPYYYIQDHTVVAPPTDHIEANNTPGWSRIQGAFWRAGGIAPGLKLEDVTPRFADESVKLIREHHRNHAAQPLMLYVAFPSPHTPWL
ncbi:MAG: sulfatase-like hydrolase/transferase, partial [Rhodospirillales bacterium]|nr:sulfatase-like hydrolase/transferase [Rhodospirillales bacterium]